MSINNNIANIYFYNDDIDYAIEHYKSVVDIAISISLNKNYIWRFKNNILSCYIHTQNLDSARTYFYELLKYPQNPGINKSESILNYSFLFNNTSQQDSALFFINMAQDSLQNIHQHTKASIAVSKFRTLLNIKKENKYIDSIQANLSMYNIPYISSEYLDCYKDIYSYYIDKDNYKKAFYYYQNYVTISDSLKAKSNSAKIKGVQFNLKYQKLQNYVKLQSEQISKQETKEILFYVILVSFVILIAITVYIAFYRNKIISILATQKEEITNQYDMLEEKNNQLESQNIEIESIVKDLKENKNRLENLNKQKDTFVSIFTHQLTNQVQAILMSAEALHLGKNKSEEIVDKFSEILYHASNHLRNMLSNLMEWSRTQAEYVKTSPVNFELQEIIDRNISSNKQAINKKQIQIVKVCKEQIVFADKAMIDTVFKNIISNAVKYSYEGGMIEFSCSIENNFIVSRIRDYGTGIRHELLEKLFNIETRVATKGTMGEQGSGLGLSICKELLALNSGKIEIETEEGKGTLVKIYLPISNSD